MGRFDGAIYYVSNLKGGWEALVESTASLERSKLLSAAGYSRAVFKDGVLECL